LPRSVELSGDELAVPAQDGLGLHDLGDLLQRFPTKTLSNLSQTDSLRVGEPQSPFDLISEDSALRHQIFVPKDQFLIHRPSDVCQHSLPIHREVSTEASARAQPSVCPENP
jgi:hypothetical protein